MAKLEPCPKCGVDFVHINSSRDLGVSEVRCGDCGYAVQRPIPEEEIEELWNALDRSAMPVIEEEEESKGPFPSLESHPYEYRLRYSPTDTDIWAPFKAAELDRLLADPHFQVRRRSHEFDMKDLAKRIEQERKAA
ncbi:hypothetical protein SAMN04487785_11442 [Dyella jiangningensis]|uniref:hypothetical protein n=1 Tax=Dyella sp. AtDHG13 TaxID=1938897 RepID=UPI000889F64D|nr:hypothetical protein [Dyella sp. AtDHG13]PXV54179.1 hypothetical protein BDW41_113132 [Dyella sp. AtDHG13]SDL05158.1 hypothetical protein SAMN04487785_11442 [Dyella jiangningensis]